jgi:hypothetical protein
MMLIVMLAVVDVSTCMYVLEMLVEMLVGSSSGGW